MSLVWHDPRNGKEEEERGGRLPPQSQEEPKRFSEVVAWFLVAAAIVWIVGIIKG